MARAALLLVVLLLAACASKAEGGSPLSEDVVGEWELVSGTSAGEALPMPDGARATLTLDGTEASGQSFCNHYGATYSVDGDDFRIDEIWSTEMACEAVMDAELQYVGALGAVRKAAFDGDELLLTGDDAELRFRSIPPVPTSDLVGTDWVLETLLVGETASSVLPGSTLRLEADGTFTATTACGSMSGHWQPTAGRVEFPSVTGGPGRNCPPGAAAQDEHELAVLNGFSVSVDEDRLTALADDGRGLVYRDAAGG